MDLSVRLKDMGSNRTVRKTLFGLLIFLVVFSVTGFFIIPPVVKSILTKKLSEELHRQVSIRQVKANPFMLSVTVRGFLVNEKNGKDAFASFDELYINLQSISVLKGGIIVSELKVDKPYLNILRNEDGSYNFSDLIRPKPKKETKPPKFSVNNIQILNGSIDFFDGPKHTRHRLRSMHIKIPFISDLPYNADIYVQPSFQAKVNDTPVSFQGKTKPFKDSLETHFDINVKDLDIPYYMAYSPFRTPFRVASGSLDINTEISYIQYASKPPSLGLTGDIALKEIRVIDLKGNPLVSLPLFETSFAQSDLIARKIHLSKILLESPEIDVSRDRSGRINLLALVPQGEPAQKTPEKEKSPASLDADDIKVTAGKIVFSDFRKTGTFKTTLEAIDIGISNLSTAQDKKAKAGISFSTESGESAKLESELSINPLMSEGTLELRKIKLRKYAPYYSQSVLFDVRSGELDLATKYLVRKEKSELDAGISGLSSTLTSLRLKKREDKDDFLDIPSLSVGDTSASLSKREVNIGQLTTRNGLLRMARSGDGKINIMGLVPEAPDSGMSPGKRVKPSRGKDLIVTLQNVAVERYTVKVEDSMPREPVRVQAERINFKGSNISTARNSKGRASLSFVFNKKGSVAAKGSVGINPVSADIGLKVKTVEISPLQAYFTDRLKIMVTQGNVSADGRLAAGVSGDGTIKASCRGEASISNFVSLDKAHEDDFLKWNSLHFGGINATYDPLFVSIDKVALTDFYSRIIINKDGSTNLQDIMNEKAVRNGGGAQAVTKAVAAESAASSEGTGHNLHNQRPSDISVQPGAATAGKKPGRLIKIDSVTLQGGTINFSDRHIQPNYSSNFMELGGRISGLSSEESKFADVDVRGKLENYAPLEITGKINPLRDDLYVDLKIDFKDMDLSPLTPYSGRYLGYTIQKGALSLNLQYLIVKKKLDSSNKVFLDQFSLGDRVESPEATKLPVRLAIALLKNRKGEIDLNIPVTGYIDDPKFSMGRIIIKILLNLLAKAATSPFALLGAVFGGGEELSYIEFDYGSADLSDQSVKKLDTIIKALFERPGLRLEIEGHVDAAKDSDGLKQYLLMRKVKAQKLKELIKKKEQVVPVDQVKIEKGEYARYLKLAYKEEKFPKPRTMLFFVKDLPVPEMEKLMLTHITVGSDDLRQLAGQRSLRVKDYILKSGKVSAERVFLVEPKTLEPEKKEKLKNSRVDFKLK